MSHHKGPPPRGARASEPTPAPDLDPDAPPTTGAAPPPSPPRPAPAAEQPADPIAAGRLTWYAHLTICNAGCTQEGPKSCSWGTTIWHDLPRDSKVGMVEEFAAARAERMRAAHKPGT